MASEARPPSGLSRRALLRGTGLAVAAGTVLRPAVDALAEDAADPGVRTQGPGAVEVTLKVNGAARKVNVEPRETLLDVLRLPLDTTGAKRVCDRAACGACTVHLDGKAVYACAILAVDAEGHEITTVEGLAEGKGAALVDAFVRHDAMQCGFCTPGMMITARALLDRVPDPDEQTIREAISGQICRCTGYTTIVRSIQWAAGHRMGEAIDDMLSTDGFSAPEGGSEATAQTETTHGSAAAEPLLESGSNA